MERQIFKMGKFEFVVRHNPSLRYLIILTLLLSLFIRFGIRYHLSGLSDVNANCPDGADETTKLNIELPMLCKTKADSDDEFCMKEALYSEPTWLDNWNTPKGQGEIECYTHLEGRNCFLKMRQGKKSK